MAPGQGTVSAGVSGRNNRTTPIIHPVSAGRFAFEADLSGCGQIKDGEIYSMGQSFIWVFTVRKKIRLWPEGGIEVGELLIGLNHRRQKELITIVLYLVFYVNGRIVVNTGVCELFWHFKV